MTSRRIEGLPNLPGNTFVDPTLCDFRRCQIFDFKNGFRIPKNNYLGIGSCPIEAKALTVKDLFDIYNYDPSLTYGKPRSKPKPPVIPAFVKLAQKTLRFYGYYKEAVTHSPDETCRVRPVEVLYYLEDDSMMVVEPKVQNSGLMQGKFLLRHKIPKNSLGETYNWRDLNLKCELVFYGRAFRIVDADQFTKNFYESEGIILNDPEVMPKDPYTDKRYLTLQKKTFTSPSVMSNPIKKLMEFNNKALRFKCVWDDRTEENDELRKYELFYYLQDDCVEVKEIHEANSGRDSFTLLLRKTRLPKDWKDLPCEFPIIYLEATAKDYVEYYEPKDFKIGETIIVFGRRFLIYDMDELTKQFYRDHFGYTDFQSICIDTGK